MSEWKKLVYSGSNAELNRLDNIVSSSAPQHKEGRIFYDAELGALTVYNDEPEISLQVGQETYIRVFNNSISSIVNGTPVYISGSQGDYPYCWPAVSEDHTVHGINENHIIGVATHTIEASSTGYVTTQGTVRGIDTSNFAAGDILFVSSSVGQITNIQPENPFDVITVGYVVRSHPSTGIIYVYPKEPTHITRVSEFTQSANYSDGDLWVYNSSKTVWENRKTNVNISGSFSGSFSGNGTQITGVVSASFAVSASWAPSSGGAGSSLGTGFTNGAGSGSIPSDTLVDINSNQVIFRPSNDGGEIYTRLESFYNTRYQFVDWDMISNPPTLTHESGTIGIFSQNDTGYLVQSTDISGQFNRSYFSGNVSGSLIYKHAYSEIEMRIRDALSSNYRQSRLYLGASGEDYVLQLSALSPGTQLINLTFTAGPTSPTASFEDQRSIPIGIEYSGDYGVGISNNDRSIPDVGTIRNYLTASFAVSASWAPGSSQSVTASYALTASYLDSRLNYVHTQSSAATTWTVFHNLNSNYLNVTVWSASKVVIPEDIVSIGENALQVVFPTAQTGYVTTTVGSFTQTQINATSATSASYSLSAVSSSYATSASYSDISISSSYAVSSVSSSYTPQTKTFGITIDGGGSAITTGIKGDITIPFDCTIDSWYLVADTVGSIVIDIWKDAFSNYPPTVLDSIAGTEKPTLSSGTSASDTNLTTWSKTVTAGDVIRFNVDSVSTLTRVNLTIKAII